MLNQRRSYERSARGDYRAFLSTALIGFMTSGLGVALFVPALLTSGALLMGCEEKPPTRMEIHPKGPFRFSDKGKRETLRLAFYDDKGQPYVRKPKEATFTVENETVATLQKGDDLVSAVIGGSSTGKTKISATAFGLEDSIEVDVTIIGKVEISKKTPEKLKLLKSHQVKVKVFDDKGKEMNPPPKVTYRASDYCIDVDPDGKVKGITLGTCQLIVTVGSASARHMFDVID